MRKLIVLTFISLDGVMQAPGGPREDESGGFTHGGWTVGYWDDFLSDVMAEQMRPPFDLLLGKKTYELFASFWPNAPEEEKPEAINQATKYVVSDVEINLDWAESIRISGDVVGEIKKLKSQAGPDLQVHGSSVLVQTLLKNDLVDELWLKIFPVTIGTGKRLFGDGTIAAGFTLLESKASPSGVIVASYQRAGAIKIGSFVTDNEV